VIDILSTSFFLKKFDSNHAEDSIILSKGHAAAALYAVLNTLGYIGDEKINAYCENGSDLYGHVSHFADNEIPLSTGSLGHGLPFALGMAMAKKKLKVKGLTIVIISDGECDEGTTWESALLASHHELENLILIIDKNGIQSIGTTKETLDLEPLDLKWESFGWQVINVDGHNCDAIELALKTKSKKPKCIIASTTKGKGVDFMEDTIEWHYKSPNEHELTFAMSQLEEEAN
jgi:transketolase